MFYIITYICNSLKYKRWMRPMVLSFLTHFFCWLDVILKLKDFWLLYLLYVLSPSLTQKNTLLLLLVSLLMFFLTTNLLRGISNLKIVLYGSWRNGRFSVMVLTLTFSRLLTVPFFMYVCVLSLRLIFFLLRPANF